MEHGGGCRKGIGTRVGGRCDIDIGIGIDSGCGEDAHRVEARAGCDAVVRLDCVAAAFWVDEHWRRWAPRTREGPRRRRLVCKGQRAHARAAISPRAPVRPCSAPAQGMPDASVPVCARRRVQLMHANLLGRRRRAARSPATKQKKPASNRTSNHCWNGQRRRRRRRQLHRGARVGASMSIDARLSQATTRGVVPVHCLCYRPPQPFRNSWHGGRNAWRVSIQYVCWRWLVDG